jgi:ketosteroid isomerase-like protein
VSEENVELIRRIYEAWGKGESARDFIHPEVEYVNPPYAVEPGTLVGRKSFAKVRSAYDDVSVTPHRFIDAGDDVVVLATITGTSRGAGVPIDREHGYVWTVADGQAIHFRWFNTPGQALEAVGLGEE